MKRTVSFSLFLNYLVLPKSSPNLQHRTIPILLSVLFSSAAAFSQSADSSLLGSWQPATYHQVKTDQYSDAEREAMTKIGFDLFKGAIFTFRHDHSCQVDMKAGMFPNSKAYWKYDSVNQQLSIMEWADRDNKDPGLLMGITVKQEQGKNLWFIHETPIVLEMVRVKISSNKLPARPHKPTTHPK